MKIISSEEIRKADAYTIEYEPVTSINLMERAAIACVKWLASSPVLLLKEKGEKSEIKVFCGLGNNGGDGLVISRLLAKKRIKVDVFIIRYSEKCSEDFLINEKRLKKINGVKVHNITSVSQLETLNLKLGTVCIDSLFGTGLNKPVEGLAADVINHINKLKCFVVAIDIPSGLFSEKNSHSEKSAIVCANHTLTFQSPKLAFMFPENGKYIGDFSVLNISLDEEFISSLPSKIYFITEQDARLILKPRNKFSHKGTFGHALIISGSHGKIGACVLVSRACLSSGAGLVTVHIPKFGYEILQTTNPEVMVETDSSDNIISDSIPLDKYNAIGIGPSIGTEKETQNAVKALIQNSKTPLVLDADAINILSDNKTWVSFLPQNSILTPHPGEFKRLVGNADNDYEWLQMQKDFSGKHGVYIVLKGAHTCITCPDGEVYFNSTGNPGMATAGSGDVLTGIITGLFAQGYDSKQASVLGVYLHGLAGDIAAENLSEESLIARNIIEFLGEALKKLRM